MSVVSHITAEYVFGIVNILSQTKINKDVEYVAHRVQHCPYIISCRINKLVFGMKREERGERERQGTQRGRS